MNVFHRKSGIMHADIVMAEIPEAFDAHCHQTADQIFRRHFRHAQNRNVRLFCLTELLQIIGMPDGDAFEDLTGIVFVPVEDAGDRKALFLKIHMGQDRSAQIARSDQDGLFGQVQSQDLADLFPQRYHVVAIALLTESAKAVEILPDLRSGQTHFRRELTG